MRESKKDVTYHKIEDKLNASNCCRCHRPLRNEPFDPKHPTGLYGTRSRMNIPEAPEPARNYRDLAMEVYYKLAHDETASGAVQLQAAHAMMDRCDYLDKHCQNIGAIRDPDLDKLSDEDLVGLIYDLQKRIKDKEESKSEDWR